MAFHCRTGLCISVERDQGASRKANIRALSQLLFITSETSLACPFGSGWFCQGGSWLYRIHGVAERQLDM